MRCRHQAIIASRVRTYGSRGNVAALVKNCSSLPIQLVDTVAAINLPPRGCLAAVSWLLSPKLAPHRLDIPIRSWLALITLEEGMTIAAQLTDIEPERVKIGLEVEMVTRRIAETGPEGCLIYGYKFQPRRKR